MSKRLIKAISKVGGITLISRVFGFIRDVVIARTFGAAGEVDAFLVAFKIPNFFRRLFAEGAFSQAFIPLMSDYQSNRPKAEVEAFVRSVQGMLIMTLLALSFLVMIFSPYVIMVFAPGFVDDARQYHMASELLKITFPYLFFIALTALGAGILNSYGVFAAPAFTPVLLNISMILSAIYLSPYTDYPIQALAWGVFIGGALQCVFQWPFLKKMGFLVMPVFRWQGQHLKRLLTLMVPGLIGVAVVQVNLLVDLLIASFLQKGSISWLYYSDRLMEFPLGVFGIALATVILPNLSSQAARQSNDDYIRTLDWALRYVLLIGLPAAMGLIMLAEPLMVSLFQYGEFSRTDSLKAAQSLMAYSLGLPAFILIKVLASGFFAKQDTKTPVKAAITAMCVNIILNIILAQFLGHMGLALATSIAAWVNALWLYVAIKAQHAYQSQFAWKTYLFQLLMANLAMGSIIWLMNAPIVAWQADVLSERLLRLFTMIFAGMLVYVASMHLFGWRFRTFNVSTEQ